MGYKGVTCIYIYCIWSPSGECLGCAAHTGLQARTCSRAVRERRLHKAAWQGTGSREGSSVYVREPTYVRE